MAWLALSTTQGSFSARSWGYIHPKVTVLLHYINTPLCLPCSIVFITTKHCIAYLFLCLCIIRLSHRNSTGATVLFWGLLYSQYLKQSLQGLWTASKSTFLCASVCKSRIHLEMPFLGLWKGKTLCEFSAEKKSPAMCIFTKLQWNLQMHNNLLCLENMQKHVKKQARVVYWFFLWNWKQPRMWTENLGQLWTFLGCFPFPEFTD